MGDLQADPAARFEQLYAQSYRSLVGYACRRTASSEDAADVVAETFLVAWRRMAVIPPGDDAVPWLYGVARKVLANQRRGAQRRDRLVHRLQFQLPPLPVAAPEPVETTTAARALDRLSDADRELLCLLAWEGLRIPEMAMALGCSKGAARVRLMRARRRFAQHFDELSRSPESPDPPACPPAEVTRLATGQRARGRARG